MMSNLAYGQLTAILTKAIKEQQTQIEELKAENDTVKAENEQLRKKLTALTDRQKAIEDMLLALSTDLPKEKRRRVIFRDSGFINLKDNNF